MAKKISFTKRDGTKVEFQDKGIRAKSKRPMNDYARFVKRNIGAYLADGMSAPEAMKAVAEQYHAALDS